MEKEPEQLPDAPEMKEEEAKSAGANKEEDPPQDVVSTSSSVAIKQEVASEGEEAELERPPPKKRRGRKPGSTNKAKKAPATQPARRSSRKSATRANYVEDLDPELLPEEEEEEIEPSNLECPELPDEIQLEHVDQMEGGIDDFDDDGLVGDDEELGPVSDFSDVEEEQEDELRPKDYSKDELMKMAPLDVFKHAQEMRQYRLSRKINYLKYKEQIRQGLIDPSNPIPRRQMPPPPPDDPTELKRREDCKLRQGLRDAIKLGRMCAELVEAMLDEKGDSRDQVTCKRILEDMASKPLSPRAILYYPRVVGVIRKCLGHPANPEVREAAAITLKNLQNLFGIEFAYFEEMFGSMDHLDVLSQTLIKKE